MGLLLKSGKQILRLSSAAAKSRQQLGISAANKYYLLTTTRKSSYLGADTKYFSTNNKQNDDVVDSKPPRTLKSFFSSIFSRTRYSPFQELLGTFMHVAEESKCYPEDRLPQVLDEIRPILKELLYRMTDRSIVKFVYEFARPAAPPSSPPPIVIDTKIKAIVDKLPPHVIHLFQDLMIDMFYKRFYVGSRYDLNVDHPESIVITANLLPNRKEHLKLFVVDNYLMVIGTDNPVLPAPARAHVLPLIEATIHQIIQLPIVPESHDKLTASILEQDQRRDSQLKIAFSCHDETEVVVNKPRVFQLNLDTEGAHQG